MVGGRRLGVGRGGGSVGRSVEGREGGGGGSDPTYLQSNNEHTSNNQCKMLMGNIIVCPGCWHCANLGVVLEWLAECEHAATHKWGGHHMYEV